MRELKKMLIIFTLLIVIVGLTWFFIDQYVKLTFNPVQADGLYKQDVVGLQPLQ